MEATAIDPPFCSMMPYTVERPIPVPSAPFVVKKGSKTFDWIASGIPQPVSVTVIRTLPATIAVLISRRPPFGIASRALMARFRTTCSR